jgi:hypothetical protein
MRRSLACGTDVALASHLYTCSHVAVASSSREDGAIVHDARDEERLDTQPHSEANREFTVVL